MMHESPVDSDTHSSFSERRRPDREGDLSDDGERELEPELVPHSDSDTDSVQVVEGDADSPAATTEETEPTAADGDDLSSRTCRICCFSESPIDAPPSEDPLLTPCDCTGSVSYVHLSCLQRWLSISNRTHCEICMSKFRLGVRHDLEMKARSIWKWMRENLINRRRAVQFGFFWCTVLLFFVGWFVEKKWLWDASVGGDPLGLGLGGLRLGGMFEEGVVMMQEEQSVDVEVSGPPPLLYWLSELFWGEGEGEEPMTVMMMLLGNPIGKGIVILGIWFVSDMILRRISVAVLHCNAQERRSALTVMNRVFLDIRWGRSLRDRVEICAAQEEIRETTLREGMWRGLGIQPEALGEFQMTVSRKFLLEGVQPTLETAERLLREFMLGYARKCQLPRTMVQLRELAGRFAALRRTAIGNVMYRFPFDVNMFHDEWTREILEPLAEEEKRLPSKNPVLRFIFRHGLAHVLIGIPFLVGFFFLQSLCERFQLTYDFAVRTCCGVLCVWVQYPLYRLILNNVRYRVAETTAYHIDLIRYFVMKAQMYVRFFGSTVFYFLARTVIPMIVLQLFLSGRVRRSLSPLSAGFFHFLLEDSPKSTRVTFFVLLDVFQQGIFLRIMQHFVAPMIFGISNLLARNGRRSPALVQNPLVRDSVAFMILYGTWWSALKAAVVSCLIGTAILWSFSAGALYFLQLFLPVDHFPIQIDALVLLLLLVFRAFLCRATVYRHWDLASRNILNMNLQALIRMHYGGRQAFNPRQNYMAFVWMISFHLGALFVLYSFLSVIAVLIAHRTTYLWCTILLCLPEIGLRFFFRAGAQPDFVALYRWYTTAISVSAVSLWTFLSQWFVFSWWIDLLLPYWLVDSSTWSDYFISIPIYVVGRLFMGFFLVRVFSKFVSWQFQEDRVWKPVVYVHRIAVWCANSFLQASNGAGRVFQGSFSDFWTPYLMVVGLLRVLAFFAVFHILSTMIGLGGGFRNVISMIYGFVVSAIEPSQAEFSWAEQ